MVAGADWSDAIRMATLTRHLSDHIRDRENAAQMVAMA